MPQVISQPVRESMTMSELSDAQAEHYTLDDNVRRLMGRLSLEDKQQVVDLIRKLSNKKS